MKTLFRLFLLTACLPLAGAALWCISRGGAAFSQWHAAAGNLPPTDSARLLQTALIWAVFAVIPAAAAGFLLSAWPRK